MRGGLTRRTALVSTALALVLATAFAGLLVTIVQLQGLESRASRAERVAAAAIHLERLAFDVQAAQDRYLLDGQADSLQAWRQAEAGFPTVSRQLLAASRDDDVGAGRATQIVDAGGRYLDSSATVVAAARAGRRSEAIAEVAETQNRLAGIRSQVDRLDRRENLDSLRRLSTAQHATRRAVVFAAVGLAGSVLLVALAAGYLHRAIVRPIRRASAMARRIAGGDLSARVPEGSVDEIGELEGSFNVMAGSLERHRDELAASRARIVAAADQARRRIERDLHDGIQQRLVSLILDVRSAEAGVPALPQVREQLSDIARGLAGALDDLQEISRGIHPAILSEGGLGPALRALGHRSPIPVELTLDLPARLPQAVEVAAYYVVSEAMANAAKHSRANDLEVSASVTDGELSLAVRDNGVGGASTSNGSGLVGLVDRVAAAGGTFTVTSELGAGTQLLAQLPVDHPENEREDTT